MKQKKTDYPLWVQELMNDGYTIEEIKTAVEWSMNLDEQEFKVAAKRDPLYKAVKEAMEKDNPLDVLDLISKNPNQ